MRACVLRFEQCNILLQYMIPLDTEHVASLAHRISTLMNTRTHSQHTFDQMMWLSWQFFKLIGNYVCFEIFQRRAIITTIVTTVTVRVSLCFRCIFLCNYIRREKNVELVVDGSNKAIAVLCLPIYLYRNKLMVLCVNGYFECARHKWPGE